MAPQYKLSYFDVRALAEPIRLLFAFQGIEYTDDRVQRDNWPAIKDSKYKIPQVLWQLGNAKLVTIHW